MLTKSPWEFKPRGESGKMVSELVPQLGELADDMCFFHSLTGKTNTHGPGENFMSTGYTLDGFPSMGAWTTWALGTENENLPSYVAISDPRGTPQSSVNNWGPGFLPAAYQGTEFNATKPLGNLDIPQGVTEATDKSTRNFLNRLNQQHLSKFPGDTELAARISSYELAARMQLSSTEALDVSKEPQYIKDMYGLAPEGPGVDDTKINVKAEREFFGRKCLVARRLLERGVRFVQVWSGNDNGHPRRNWDSHENIERDHGPLASGMATGAAALIKDLKQRGMLDDTIILWTTEFGRMPCAQRGVGRDHNPFVFTNWLCGGGIKGGVTHGESDQWGYKPLDPANSTQVYDIHATILHLLGIDHERLTVRHNSIDRRLTDVHGRVVREILG